MNALPETSAAETFRNPEEWGVARDRVLLYIRGLNPPPFKDLELAFKSLESAASASPGDAMRALFGLLKAHDSARDAIGAEREHIVSSPPINRGVMVAEPMDRIPWRTAFIGFLRRRRRELLAPKGTR